MFGYYSYTVIVKVYSIISYRFHMDIVISCSTHSILNLIKDGKEVRDWSYLLILSDQTLSDTLLCYLLWGADPAYSNNL